MKQKRALKIQCKFRKREYDTIIIPQIRMEGKWLENLGFKIGNEIIIKPQKNKLIITINKNAVEK